MRGVVDPGCDGMQSLSMSISAEIRKLAQQGLATNEIARQLGISYQHAYNVLRQSKLLTSVSSSRSLTSAPAPNKPSLFRHELLTCGFSLAGSWRLDATGNLSIDQALPKEIGVYALVKDETALYVGLATMGLSKRLYFYARPGATQRTSLRINALLKQELAGGHHIEIYTATPPNLDWNGLPIHGSAGLELGLIEKHHLPWNIRSAR